MGDPSLAETPPKFPDVHDPEKSSLRPPHPVSDCCVRGVGIAMPMNETKMKDPESKEFFAVMMSMVFVVLLLGGLNPFEAEAASGERKPLDMPSGGRGADDDEEDAPETIIFYGNDYEGDAFFWCLDKSGSMEWGGAMEDLQQEVTEAVNSLSPQAEFSIVAFSSNTVTWSTTPKAATTAQKAAAIAWVNSLVPDGWTCLAPAAITMLQICNQSSKPARQMLILSDGVPTCDGVDTTNQTLSEITAANWQQVPIHTIYINDDSEGISFMQLLAAQNFGSFYIFNN